MIITLVLLRHRFSALTLIEKAHSIESALTADRESVHTVFIRCEGSIGITVCMLRQSCILSSVEFYCNRLDTYGNSIRVFIIICISQKQDLTR